MYTKLIKFVVLLSLVLLSGFAGRVLYSPLLNRASQGRDPRHSWGEGGAEGGGKRSANLPSWTLDV